MKIILNKSIYEQLASDLNRTYKTIKSTIKDLIKDELIVQYKNDYIINPQYF
jgi:predicted transcriptional regulator